jgi:cytochrome P450
LIANALFRLPQNPGTWQELRATALGLGEEPELNFETLKTIMQFRDVINETLRSTGPSARVVQTAFKDNMLPKGGGPNGDTPVFVEKGDQVAIIVRGCNYNKQIWGEDSYEFKLNRWNQRRSPWGFCPSVVTAGFSGVSAVSYTSHICLGMAHPGIRRH